MSHLEGFSSLHFLLCCVSSPWILSLGLALYLFSFCSSCSFSSFQRDVCRSRQSPARRPLVLLLKMSCLLPCRCKTRRNALMNTNTHLMLQYIHVRAQMMILIQRASFMQKINNFSTNKTRTFVHVCEGFICFLYFFRAFEQMDVECL